MSRLTRFMLILGAVAYITSTAYLYSRVVNTNNALSRNVNAQVSNRAANVRAWCGGINESRAYDRAFVRHVTRGTVAYRLRDLPCDALVAKTLKSAQHK